MSKPTPFILSALLLLLAWGTAEAHQKISISHATNVQDPEGLIQLHQGEQFEIDITHTFPDCFLYNLEAIKAAQISEAQPAGESAPASITEGTVPFHITHDRSIGSYKITIVAKVLTDELKELCDAVSQKPQTYTVNVTTYEWTVSFAGTFASDSLAAELLGGAP